MPVRKGNPERPARRRADRPRPQRVWATGCPVGRPGRHRAAPRADAAGAL